MTLSTDKINKEVKLKRELNEDSKGLKDNKALIDKLRKFLEEKQGEFPQMEPYRPPSWFKRINPETLPNDLEGRYKDLEKRFAIPLNKKKKRGISDKDMLQGGSGGRNAKGGTIKVYAKGGGVRKPSY